MKVTERVNPFTMVVSAIYQFDSANHDHSDVSFGRDIGPTGKARFTVEMSAGERADAVFKTLKEGADASRAYAGKGRVRIVFHV